MYMIISILLGLCLSSFFICGISKREQSTKSMRKCNIINIVVIGVGEILAYLYIRSFGEYASLAVIITLIVTAFETACDICYMRVYTLPVYIAYIPIIFIKSSNMFMAEMYWQLTQMYMLIILFAVICYCLSVLTHGSIGDGDFDMYFLVFLTSPIFAIILAITAVIDFIRKSLFVRRGSIKSSSSASHTMALSKPMPFVPLIFFGYVICLIGGAMS